MMFASASQLAQSRPSGTSAVTLYTATMRTEITSLIVANTSNASAHYSVYHDDDGTSYAQGTALVYEASLNANTSTVLYAGNSPGGITVQAGGSIGVKSGTASAITYSIYGVTERRGA